MTKRSVTGTGIGAGTVAVAFAAALLCTATLQAQERPAEMDAARDARVHIYNPSGSVKVTGWDREQVAVYASRSNLRDLELSGDRNRITMRVQNGFSIEVRVPHGAQLIVECGSGSVDISGVDGTVEAESSSGSVQITGAPHSIAATGFSGGVTIMGGGTEITHAESVSGSVVITDAHGVVDAKSSSGSVSVSGDVRDAHLFSVSGDVEFRGTVASAGRLSAESSSASVELKLPRNTSAEYELTTVSGEIDNEFGPTATHSRNGAGVTLRFSIDGGDARIKAASVSGSVHLNSR
jgi:DUF4097 and DUF4098 domain-containing protein YvlB